MTHQIQCAEERGSPGAVYWTHHVHKMQKPLKLPQVQHISKTGQKVQQSTEVSQQQYMDMNVDVPAEMQRQNTVNNAQIRRQVRTMPGGIRSKVQNMLLPGSSEAVQSPGPVLQISSRRQTSLRGFTTHSADGASQGLSNIAFRKEGAHRIVQTMSRQISEMWGRPRNSARYTAEREERAQ